MDEKPNEIRVKWQINDFRVDMANHLKFYFIYVKEKSNKWRNGSVKLDLHPYL